MQEVIFTAVFGAVTSTVTWFAARRKNTSEVQANELDNAVKAVGYYREMLDDMAVRYKTAMEELKALKELITELEERVKLLADDNRELIEELKKYKQLNGKSNDNKR